jgi:hypothetical protein
MQDTYSKAIQDISFLLLASGIEMTPYKRKQLEDRATVSSCERVYTDFIGAGTDVFIAVDNALRWNTKKDSYVYDEEGNEYLKTKIKVEINYPSHGICSAAVFQNVWRFLPR